MIANEIVEKLKATTYKFTYAQTVKDTVKKMDEPERAKLLSELRRELSNPKNVDIHKPLREILN